MHDLGGYETYHMPHRVYADASDYAIGGYVCQVVNGVEKPRFHESDIGKCRKKMDSY